MDLRDEARTAGEPAVETLPVVPLRDNVVFPQQLAPLGAGRPRSVGALEAAVGADGRVVLAVQRSAEVDDVSLADLHPIAVIAHVGAFRRMPTGAQALVEGQRRVRIESLETDGERWTGTVVSVEDTVTEGNELDALAGSVKSLFGEYVVAGAAVAPEVAVAVSRATEPARIADVCSAAPDLAPVDKVALLQETDVAARLRLLVPLLAKQVEVAQLRSKINEDVQKTINKGQREHILREQLRAIKRELAELEGTVDDEDDLATRVANAGMPDAVRARTLKEVSRLEQIPQASPELGMVRTYVDWLLDLPWADPAPEEVDIERAKQILDEDHYGLPKVKDRLLEWLAVRQRTLGRQRLREAERAAASQGDAPSPPPASDAPSTPTPAVEEPRPRRALQTPILCLVGPPGVGKTSLGRSIARAMDRRFVRMSLGGIRDEAEIRGHRRTYIGALPGRIIQSMKQAGTRNPVIMLDEIDKVGADFRGDPSAALLEVLDPEQNREFSDHYLEVPYDLSQVLFITTANVAETIGPALRDRMELIRITGYTEAEKLGIAERHLVPRQMDQHGLDSSEMEITGAALLGMIRGYTHEAGVRQLERTIAQVCRKVPRKLVESGSTDAVVVRPGDLEEYLGPQRFDFGEAEEEDQVGAVTGVVVSEVGGDIVTVEALAIEGKNELLLTGQLGNVMEESARAALSWSRVNAHRYGARKGFFDNHGLHIHVPAGGIPKDGPSAGVTMVTAMVSAASGRKVDRRVAMTGEVTLRGRVLPIGGVKDKLLAAHRAGIAVFLLPRRNERDLREVDREILDRIEVVPVDNVDQVLARALLPGGERRHGSDRRAGFVITGDGTPVVPRAGGEPKPVAPPVPTAGRD
jgi:ATP-dependent Lon protease